MSKTKKILVTIAAIFVGLFFIGVVFGEEPAPPPTTQQVEPTTAKPKPKRTTAKPKPKPTTAKPKPKPTTAKPKPKPTTAKPKPPPPPKPKPPQEPPELTKEQEEELFLLAVRQYISKDAQPHDSKLVTQGRVACQLLDEGKTAIEATEELYLITDLEPGEAAYLVGAAVGTMCEEHRDKIPN